MQTALDFWRGKGGDDYTARNRVDWTKRIPFWRAIVTDLKPQTVIEIGCNAGWNLMAIRAVAPKVEVVGIEPNDAARAEARDVNAIAVSPTIPIDIAADAFDIAFTAGVLIHVPSPALANTMEQIITLSRQYVISIEYEAETETEIAYRGEMGLLWKRPYGKLYEDMGLELLGSAFLPPESGFDNCQYRLLRKK